MNTGAWRRRLDAGVRELEAARALADAESDRLDWLTREGKAIERAQAIAQEVAASVQHQAHRRIADMVSRCLAAVFDNPYTFRIRFERKRGKTEARLELERDGHPLDALSETGGGVVDVAAFALRLACLLMQRPPLRRLLVLDEPFKHLSPNYRPRVRELLITLSEELGVQIVMVTQDNELEAGQVLRLDGSRR